MSKVIQNALYVGSTTLGVILVLTNSTLGADFSRSTMGKNESATVMGQSTPYLENNDCYIPNTLTQVTSVSQLSDIKNFVLPLGFKYCRDAQFCVLTILQTCCFS